MREIRMSGLMSGEGKRVVKPIPRLSSTLLNPAEAARTLLGFGWEHERETWGTVGPDEVEDYGLLRTVEVEDIMTRVFGTEWPRIADDEDDAA